MRVLAVLILALTATRVAAQPAPADDVTKAVTKGVAYLSVQVPRWQSTNGCASCHHNADAARALLVAAKRGYDIGTSIDTTLAFLAAPDAWAQNKSEPGVHDPSLARLQFASALAVAARYDRASDAAVKSAAKLLLASQGTDGVWAVDPAQARVTAATHGPILTAWAGRSALIAAGREPDDVSVVAVDKWLRGATIETVTDAATMVIALESAEDLMAENFRADALRLLRERVSESGGWAAEADGFSDAFTTALATLALGTLEGEPTLARKVFRPEELRESIRKSRQFLASVQQPDGSWREAGSISGKPSAAQRVATTSWALLALLGGAGR